MVSTDGGAILLQAGGVDSGILVHADIETAGADLTLLAEDSLSIAAGVDLLTTGGPVDLEATTGSVSMADDSRVVSGGGNVRIIAAGTFAVGVIDVGTGIAALTATAGSIDDAVRNKS